MKRKIAIVLLAVMLLTLVACQRAPKGTTWQHIMKDDEVVTLVINFDQQTITAGGDLVIITAVDNNGTVIGGTPQKEGDVYHYTFEDENITITYPNGATWWTSSTAGGWSDDYDPERYIDGDTLAQQLTQAYQYSRKNWDHVLVVGFFSLIIIVVSILDIKHPDVLHRMRYGLWVQNAEPTEFALTISRLCGVVAIVLAVIGFLVVLFS